MDGGIAWSQCQGLHEIVSGLGWLPLLEGNTAKSIECFNVLWLMCHQTAVEAGSSGEIATMVGLTRLRPEHGGALGKGQTLTVDIQAMSLGLQFLCA